MLKKKPETLKAFHEPVRFFERPQFYHVCRPFQCPFVLPHGMRYAVFFCGMSAGQPINDMEFLYRTLVDLYGFDSGNIYVLHFDGTLSSWPGTPTAWPGDGTGYRIQVNGAGTRASFEAVIDELKLKLKGDDLLLVHTNQCGGRD